MYRSNDKQNVFDTIEKWGLKSLESRGERVEHGAKTKRLGTLLKVGGRFILGGDFLRFSARIICSTSGRRKKEDGRGSSDRFFTL